MNLERDSVGAVILGAYEHISEGDTVKCTGRILEVPVGPTPGPALLSPLASRVAPIPASTPSKAPVTVGNLYVAGRVWVDTNGDGKGDKPLPGAKLHLNDNKGNNILVESTDQYGLFEFFNVAPGKYQIHQINVPEYTLVTDTEGDPHDSTIAVDLTNGTSSYDNTFIDATPNYAVPVTNAPGKGVYIAGRVWGDTNGDGVGEEVLPNVQIALNYANGSNFLTETTDKQGLYEFFNIPPDKYLIQETNLPGYTDVSDTQGDPHDSTITLDVSDGTDTYGNDFIDAPPSKVSPQATIAPTTDQHVFISGRVWADTNGDGSGDVVLPGVKVAINDQNDNTLFTDSTDDNGQYGVQRPSW